MAKTALKPRGASVANAESGSTRAKPVALRAPARRENLPAPLKAVVQLEDRDDHFVVKNGVRCAGVHLIIDLYDATRLDDMEHIEAALRRAVDASAATLLHIHLHHFEPNGGVSGVAVLAESHISIHTWPEVGYAALDVFMCGKANPDACVPVLREAFLPKDINVSEVLRGRGA
jgi:S-adenosylmethionine decarboxylase